MPEKRNLTVLIVEDGDEYLENLSRFVSGPHYLQAKSGLRAVELLQTQPVDLLYVDMRFDRIPKGDLLGDHDRATREHNGDPVRAFRFLQNNQGLFVLEHVRKSGFGHLPAVLAYDFSREQRRWKHLKSIHPSLHWVPDAVTPGEIRALLERATLC